MWTKGGIFSVVAKREIEDVRVLDKSKAISGGDYSIRDNVSLLWIL